MCHGENVQKRHISQPGLVGFRERVVDLHISTCIYDSHAEGILKFQNLKGDLSLIKIMNSLCVAFHFTNFEPNVSEI